MHSREMPILLKFTAFTHIDRFSKKSTMIRTIYISVSYSNKSQTNSKFQIFLFSAAAGRVIAKFPALRYHVHVRNSLNFYFFSNQDDSENLRKCALDCFAKKRLPLDPQSKNKTFFEDVHRGNHPIISLCNAEKLVRILKDVVSKNT